MRGASPASNGIFVETSQAGGRVIVAVIGRVTVETSPHLRPVLTEAISDPREIDDDRVWRR
jgi:hypothetical protein